MQNLLGLFHGLDFLATHFLIGFLFFYSLIQKADGASAEAVNPNWVKNLTLLIILNFISTFIWMMFSINAMTEAWSFKMIWMGMVHTSFAETLSLKLLSLFFLMISLKWIASFKYSSLILVLVTIILPFGNVMVSHAAVAEDYRNYKIVLDWMHSLSVGVWTGGLVALYFWLNKKIETRLIISSDVSHKVVKRFSRFAMGSTFLIASSGLILAKLNGVSILKPCGTEYGKLLLLKIIIFCLALFAAAINQFLHLRTWHPDEELKFSKAIKREVGLEIIFITIIFLVAGFLTRTALPS